MSFWVTDGINGRSEEMRIGCAAYPEKWARLGWPNFIAYAESRGVEVVYIDLTKPIESQGPFSVIVHKLTYLMNGNNLPDHPEIRALVEFCEKHPEIPFVDDLQMVARTRDRGVINADLEAIKWPADLPVCIPRSSIITDSDADSIARATENLRFPILAKSSQGTGRPEDHFLRLATDPQHLHGLPVPALLSEFAEHNGVVYKGYTMGKYVSVDVRPSLRNVKQGEVLEAVIDSHDLSNASGIWTDEKEIVGKEVPMEVFQRISDILRESLKLNLFGFDILIDGQGKYWLVDLNYFPSYKNIDCRWEKFLDFFIDMGGKSE
jgi:inositol-1,3,4-trisphosphate 5/6-kinase/inositol-tetrakisphosphate 1-kinase